MPTVPQPYVYLIADLPGGVFSGQSSDRLLWLFANLFPAGINPVINSDEVEVTITFDEDLEQADKDDLDDLVPHCTDYFIVSTDGGTTDLGEPATVSKAAGLLSSTNITLKLKNGDGADINGFAEPVLLRAPIMTISTIEGNLNASGSFTFTVGALLDRGEAQIAIEVDSLPQRTLIARWT